MSDSDAEHPSREERVYHKTCNLLTHRDGFFQYLPVAGTPGEAAAQGLLALMGGISERFMCASWLTNLEYALWECRESGQSAQFPEITQRQCALLRLLSDECDGWWMYSLYQPESDDPPVEFVSLDTWRKHIETRWVHRGGFRAR
jgi:hypothetical protein